MAKELDFYFDFSSPYGYFAAMRIEALAAKYQRTVKWHPILLGAVFKISGAVPLTMVPMKSDYALHDFERTARLNDIRFNQPPTFPIATLHPARAMVWLQQTAGDEKAIAFAKATYQAYFVDGVDINEPANLQKIVAQLGLDAKAMLEGINSTPIKEHLKSNIEQAMQRQVFGSPFVIVGGESFWGFDRFGQLEIFLQNGAI